MNVNAAGHKKVYRESRARARRLLTEGSRAADETFRTREGQRRTPPWRLQVCLDGKRAGLRCPETQRKVGQGSADCARHRRKQSVGRSSYWAERSGSKHQRLKVR